MLSCILFQNLSKLFLGFWEPEVVFVLSYHISNCYTLFKLQKRECPTAFRVLHTLDPLRFDGCVSPPHRELVEAMLSFSPWWACFSSWTNLCDLNSSFEICLGNLVEFYQENLLVFKCKATLFTASLYCYQNGEFFPCSVCGGLVNVKKD